MIVPELPNYLSSIGGEDYKGLIISLFTVTAGLSRPFSGKLADTVGRIPVMVFGAVVCFICGWLYPVLGTVFGFLFLRFVHGFSTGFKPTGTSAYVADIVPYQRRGEAMGIQGFFASSGMAAGNAIGPIIAAATSIDTLFYISSLVALVSVLVLIGMKETVKDKKKFSLSLLKINWGDVYEPLVLPAGIVVLLSVISFGMMLTIIPDFSDHLGLGEKNRGLYFTVFLITSLIMRIVAGRASDNYGRVIVLRISTLLLVIAMVLTGLAVSKVGFLMAAVIYGLAVGINTPTIYAWTIDLSLEAHRGRGIATMYIALEVGIGLGALLSGFVYNNDPTMFKWVFWLGGFAALLAFLYLITSVKPDSPLRD